MLFLPATYIAILMYALYAPAASATSNEPDTAAARTVHSQEMSDDKDATEGQNHPDKTQNDTPVEAVKQSDDKRPLLPERPKDFNAMMPPVAISGDDGTGVPAGFAGAGGGVPGMYMAELGGLAVKLVHFTRWLVIVTVAGTILFFIQLIYLRSSIVLSRKSLEAVKVSTDISQRNLAVMQETSQKELRAYVFSNGAKGDLLEDKSGAYGVKVEVRNFGRTPAYGLSGWMTVFVDDVAREIDITSMPQESEVVQTVLPPGGVCYYYARTSQPVMRELKAIAAVSRAIYVYGEVRYKDVFSVEHFSRFRIKCTGERNLKHGSFDHCVAGNEAS